MRDSLLSFYHKKKTFIYVHSLKEQLVPVLHTRYILVDQKIRLSNTLKLFMFNYESELLKKKKKEECGLVGST